MLPQKIFKFYHCRNLVSCILKLKTRKIAILDNLIETWYQYPPHKLVQTHACNTETFQMVFYGAQFFLHFCNALWEGKVAFTASKFAWCPALKETPEQKICYYIFTALSAKSMYFNFLFNVKRAPFAASNISNIPLNLLL